MTIKLSKRFQSMVAGALLALAAVGGAQAQQAGVALNTPTSVTADVLPGATSVELQIPVSALTRLRLDAIVPVDNAVISLVDPRGVTVVAPGDSRVRYNPGNLLPKPLPGGVFELPELGAPINGTWKLQVGFPPAAQRTVVLASVIAVSRYQVGIALDRDVLLVGEDAAIGVVVQDNGSPFRGLSPTLTITRVGGSGSTLPTRDDGTGPDGKASDGVYSAERTFTEAGDYELRADVSFDPGTGLVTRSVRQRIKVVSPPLATPTITLSNQLGSGGCVSGLQVNLGLNALKADRYATLVQLTGPNGRTIDVRKGLDLAVGTSSVSSVFTSQDIKQSIGVDGPYNVSLIDILETGGDDFLLAFRKRNAGSFNLTLAALCNLPIELAAPLSVTPVLKNGYIGSLDFTIPIRVTASGSYQISFKVISASGADFGLLNASRSLVAGVNNVTVNVASPLFLTNDGPYKAISLLVVGGGSSAQASDLGSSAAYSRWQFAPRINGDLNNDGSVNSADNSLMTQFRNIPALVPGDRRDLNRDGVIDLRDARELQRLACTSPNCPVVP